MKLTAEKLFELKIADEIIKEPIGGAHKNYKEAAEFLAQALDSNLKELTKMSPAELKEQRYQKFRGMGEVLENPEIIAKEVVIEEK